MRLSYPRLLTPRNAIVTLALVGCGGAKLGTDPGTHASGTHVGAMGTVAPILIDGGSTMSTVDAAMPLDATPSGETSTEPSGGSETNETGGAPSVAAYPGMGFVVHEWGTNTIVAGSDGSLQRGLHHEEEDLPPFVYDRIRAGALPSGSTVKMETPVTYFYSPVPRKVAVQVKFPDGVFSQWFPAVKTFSPPVALIGAAPGVGDQVLQVDFPFQTQACIDRYHALANGVLDWGDVQVLARDSPFAPAAAPLEQYTWGFARAVGANPIQVVGIPGATTAPEAERFLFYRGVGNVPLPLSVKASAGGALSLTNTDISSPLGSLFVLNVGDTQAAFRMRAQGVAAGATISETAPDLMQAPPIQSYVDGLSAAVTSALDSTGLYHDESVAMVATWSRQWFRTPGLRILYLSPQTWTDAQIPLSITPSPDVVRRVMMIRIEVLTPELEAIDLNFAAALGTEGPSGPAAGHFRALGRFAEPRLRRALSILANPMPSQGATALLTSLAHANASSAL